jgi:hypothetical protein
MTHNRRSVRLALRRRVIDSILFMRYTDCGRGGRLGTPGMNTFVRSRHRRPAPRAPIVGGLPLQFALYLSSCSVIAMIRSIASSSLGTTSSTL